MAMDLVGHIKQLEIPHLPDTKFKVRIGIHSGKLSIHLRLFHAKLVSTNHVYQLANVINRVIIYIFTLD